MALRAGFGTGCERLLPPVPGSAAPLAESGCGDVTVSLMRLMICFAVRSGTRDAGREIYGCVSVHERRLNVC